MSSTSPPALTQFKKSTWRLVQTSAASGAWNMAVDEAILEAAGRNEVRPTLRLYAWSPACLSLGYAQNVADANLQALQRFSWGIVRRPTGGRAILHTDELTYAVIGPPNEPRLAGSVIESYRRLAGALLYALQLLNLPAQAVEKPIIPPGTDPQAAVCFEVPSNYEITVKGKKLLGSAQARRREGVLQHGSLPLSGDLLRITYALAFPTPEEQAEAGQRLLARATTAEQVLGFPLTWEQAAQAFREAFSKRLNLKLEPGELSQAETRRADELVKTKFGNDLWTNRI